MLGSLTMTGLYFHWYQNDLEHHKRKGQKNARGWVDTISQKFKGSSSTMYGQTRDDENSGDHFLNLLGQLLGFGYMAGTLAVFVELFVRRPPRFCKVLQRKRTKMNGPKINN